MDGWDGGPPLSGIFLPPKNATKKPRFPKQEGYNRERRHGATGSGGSDGMME